MLKEKLEKNSDFSEVVSEWPQIKEGDWELFKDYCETASAKAFAERGKNMRKQNIGDHRLGSGGYEGKEAVWRKEDEELLKESDGTNP